MVVCSPHSRTFSFSPLTAKFETEAVAGRQAESIMNEVHRQSDLCQRESNLRQREHDMDAKEALFERNAVDLQEAIRDILQVSGRPQRPADNDPADVCILETVRDLDAASTVAYKKLLRSSHDLHDIYDVQNIRNEIVVDKLSTGILLRKFIFISAGL